MDIDVAYRVNKDIAWQYIKQYVRKNSIKSCTFYACLDNYITKKIIWNTKPLLKGGGFLFIVCNSFNVSTVVNICYENEYDYDLIYCKQSERHMRMSYYDDCITPIVVIHNNDRNNIKLYKTTFSDVRPNFYDIQENNFIEYWSNYMITKHEYGDNALFIGDESLLYMNIFHNNCVNSIGFGFDNMVLDKLNNNGIALREVE